MSRQLAWSAHGAQSNEETEQLLNSGLASPDITANAALARAEERKRRSSLTAAGQSLCISLLGLIFLMVIVLYARERQASSMPDTQKPSDPLLLISMESSQPVAAKSLAEQPRGDTRKYQYVVLENGLQVLNVQDTRASQVAMAMAVESGSFNDPDSLPGLAHFCEHMLFLGTEKYPDPNGFDSFMAENGGFNNAYTAHEATVYFGEFFSDALEEGLDRFADFFRAPLFNRSYVEREVHAIDSEHAKNVQDPAWRIQAVMYSLANSESKVADFSTGNIETLYKGPQARGEDTVDALQVYFDDHYCPEHMHLVTFGPMSLEEQLKLSIADFGKIKPGNEACRKPVKKFADPPAYPKTNLAKWVDIEGTKPSAQLWIHFPLPDVSTQFRSQPLDYLSYVLGFTGVDSLNQVLTDKLGLATSAGPSFDTTSASSNLFFVVDLTPKGADNIDLLLNVFFAYMSTVRQKGVDLDFYSSIADIAKLNWDWSEMPGASSFASELAERMTRIPVAHILSGDSLIKDLNGDLVETLFTHIRPDNMNIGYVHAKKSGTKESFTSLLKEGVKVDSLPYYGVQYAVMDLSQKFPGNMKMWKNWLDGHGDRSSVDSEITSVLAQAKITKSVASASPPKPFQDVPKDINLDNVNAAIDQSSTGMDAKLYGAMPARGEGDLALIRHGPATEGSEVWYREGWVTTSPKANIQLIMRILKSEGEPDISPQQLVELRLFNELLGDELDPQLAALSETGASYSVGAGEDGLTFNFAGFTPVMDKLIDSVVAGFNKFNSNLTTIYNDRFQREAQLLREQLASHSDMPVSYAIRDRNLLLTKGAITNEEELEALDRVTLQSAQESAGRLLLARPLHLTALAMGNLPKEAADDAVSRVASGVKVPEWVTRSTETGGKAEYMKPIVQIKQPIEVRVHNPREGDDNDVAVVSILDGIATISSRVLISLLGDILQPLAYQELRTTRQLGYVVSAGTSMMSNVLYISCVVQGNTLNADDAEAAIEYVYTELMPQRLHKLTDSEFEDFKNSFVQQLITPPARTGDELGHFWTPIAQGGQCFGIRDEMLRYLNSSMVTKAALINTWSKLVTPKQGVRRKIAVKYFSKGPPQRPDVATAQKSWKKQGVTSKHAPLLAMEHDQAVVLDSVNSAARDQLVEVGGGYYPLELHCKMSAHTEAMLDETDKSESPIFLQRRREHTRHVALTPR